VPYEDVRGAPHGAEFDVAPTVVGPAEDGATARFDLLAPDVAVEVRAALDALSRAPVPGEGARPFLLCVRRRRHVMNSLGRDVPGAPEHNPCSVHPDDLAALGVDDGALLELTTDAGRVTAVAEADATLRRGVVNLTHCHGDVARLLTLTDHRQPVSAMPWMSAVPVTLTRAGGARASADGDGGGR
jgi:anaerobic selenocysteine-containing dehydrogenase